MAKRFHIAIFIFFLLPHTSSGFCFDEAGATYGISPLLLWSIAKNESNFNPQAIGHNSNGTYDFGLMQINSSWQKRLGKDLLEKLGDPCTNVKTGAWILSQCIRRHGYGWKAVGCYNSNTPGKRERYAWKISRIMENAWRSSSRVSYARENATNRLETEDSTTNTWDNIFGQAM